MTATKSSPKIVIVGGGMVGISLALMLAQQASLGAQIILVEKYPLDSVGDSPLMQPSFDSRSTAVNEGARQLLASVGVDIRSFASSIAEIQVSDQGHYGACQLSAEDYDVNALGYVVENKQLGEQLQAKLASSSVECISPAQVTQCKPCKQGYELSIQQQEKQIKLKADLLVIADGAQSQLRASLGIDCERYDHRQVALVSTVVLDQAHQNIAYERFTPSGPIALLPLSEYEKLHRAALVWTIPAEQLETVQAMDEPALLARLQQQFGYRAGKIRALGKIDFFPLVSITAKEQLRSHLAVIGNAAHFLHPVAGQGFNLALRDCYQLSQTLKAANARNEILGSYKSLISYIEKQHSDQALTIHVTQQMVKLFSNDDWSLSLFRQLGFQLINHLPPLKNRFVQQMMGNRS